MRKLFRRLVSAKLVSASLAAALLAGAAVTSGAQVTPASRRKLAQAEAAADRLIERFHATLDFGPVFDEFFVTEPGLRSRALVLGNEPKAGVEVSDYLAERNFKAVMTFMHLFAEYGLATEEEIPKDVERAVDDAKFFRYIKSDDEAKPATAAELEQAVAEMQRASALFRAHFTPDLFRRRLYLKNVADERRRAAEHNKPRVERGYSKYGLGPGVPVYVVRREAFDYYFVEEGGAFKLFYVDILPDFRITF